QIGIAFGSLEQKLPLPLLTLEHTQNTLEAYWNWSLIGGLLLTLDVQYIRNPAFAPDRNSAWISSLRTTLVF
ncbi:MAG: carbohydrate porin, partial [Azonexus sp.]